MTSRPPTEPLSRTTRLLAAVAIALVALGITRLAHHYLGEPAARKSADTPADR